MGTTAVAKASAPKTTKQVVAISVKLEIITPDRLRKIIFGLTKGTADGLTTWKIDFELYDKDSPTGEFLKVIDVEVEVKSKNHPLAEVTAEEGMNAPQVEHAITRAAPAAAKLAAGKGKQSTAERSIEGVLTARNG